jgi:PRC-barrel domain
MVKKFLIVSATTALMATSALAQQSTPPSDPPAATPPAATPSPAPSGSASASGKFMTSQSADQFVASKFKGMDVVGPNNEKIGDVDDMLFDKNGKILAYIVGVGGFLGIGQKDVALDTSAFQMVSGDTGNTGATGTSASGSADPSDMKLKLSMTKDELKNAPAFEYYKAPARTTGTGTGGTGTTGSSPRPATPTR